MDFNPLRFMPCIGVGAREKKNPRPRAMKFGESERFREIKGKTVPDAIATGEIDVH